MKTNQTMVDAAMNYLAASDNSKDLSVAMCLFDSEVKRQADGDLNYAIRLARKAFRHAFNLQRQAPTCQEHP